MGVVFSWKAADFFRTFPKASIGLMVRLSDAGSCMLCCTDLYKPIFTPSYLAGGFKYFLFSPLPGEVIQFD